MDPTVVVLCFKTSAFFFRDCWGDPIDIPIKWVFKADSLDLTSLNGVDLFFWTVFMAWTTQVVVNTSATELWALWALDDVEEWKGGNVKVTPVSMDVVVGLRVLILFMV